MSDELEPSELAQPVTEPAEAQEPEVQAAAAKSGADAVEPKTAEAAPQAAAAESGAPTDASSSTESESEAATGRPPSIESESEAAATTSETVEAAPEAATDEPGAAADRSSSAGSQPAPNPNFKWYILHAYSGFERKVRESIESRVQAFGLKDRVGRVMIPTEPVTEIINGKKRTVERVFLPGYVLVEMELDNNLWHVLKDTPKVTGFLGTGDKPVALSEEEVSSILFRSETAKEKPRLKIKFEKSEQVRITDGPFANFNGVVDEINEDRETLKVMVTIFGRSTPVELEFGKVEKIA